MTAEHDQPKRWRPRFSVRTLVVVVTLVCCYAACWGPTKTHGASDIERQATTMPHERDKASANPYEPPSEPPDDAMIERQSRRLPWWLRPGGTPSILVALPFFVFLMVAIVIGLSLSIIQWLWQ